MVIQNLKIIFFVHLLLKMMIPEKYLDFCIKLIKLVIITIINFMVFYD